jgi:hypothetical protein
MMLVYLFHADLWANAVLETNDNGGKRNASAPRGGGRRSSEIGAPHTFCSPATRAHACSRHKTAELVSPRGPSEPSQQDFSVHLAYIDCSNLFIKAQKVSAMVQGWTRSLAEVSLQLPARLAFPDSAAVGS